MIYCSETENAPSLILEDDNEKNDNDNDNDTAKSDDFTESIERTNCKSKRKRLQLMEREDEKIEQPLDLRSETKYAKIDCDKGLNTINESNNNRE